MRSIVTFPTAALVVVMLGAIPLTGLAMALNPGEIPGTYSPVSPDSNGNCPSGYGSTPTGCCPLGTENVHNFCEAPSEHNSGS